MGKSTQKVGKGDLVSNSFSSLLSQSHGKSRQVARLKASKLQEAPNAKYTEKCIFSRVSEATLGSFPVYKGFKNMGKSTQKVGKGDL